MKGNQNQLGEQAKGEQGQGDPSKGEQNNQQQDGQQQGEQNQGQGEQSQGQGELGQGQGEKNQGQGEPGDQNGQGSGNQGGDNASQQGGGSGYDEGSKDGYEKTIDLNGERVMVSDSIPGYNETLTGQANNSGNSSFMQSNQSLTWAGQSVEYNKVVGQYTEQAYSNLQQSKIPESMKSLIKDYFTELNK